MWRWSQRSSQRRRSQEKERPPSAVLSHGGLQRAPTSASISSAGAREVRRLREENAALRARVEELENQAHEEHQHLPLDAWHALGEAIAQGSQRVVSQILANSSLLKLVRGSAADADTDADDAEEAEDPEMQDSVLLSSRSLLTKKATLSLRVDNVSHLPTRERLQHNKSIKNGYLVTATVDRTGASAETAIVWSEDGHVEFTNADSQDPDEASAPLAKLGKVVPSDMIVFRVDCQYLASVRAGLRMCIGEVRVCVADLLRQSCVLADGDGLATATVWIKDQETDIVIFNDAGEEPCRVQVSIDFGTLAQEEGFPLPREETQAAANVRRGLQNGGLGGGDDDAQGARAAHGRLALSLGRQYLAEAAAALTGANSGNDARGADEREDAQEEGDGQDDEELEEDSQGSEFAKHVFVCTRGTRGDVQPFIALARGLAEHCGFLVTICTEDRYRPLVERYSDVSRGWIQFRTSGGDTEKRISTAVAQWALRQNSMALQLAMLGHSEREFFDSEPMFHYWCRALRPDVILFGFTTAHIAMILSESLQIPLLGFLLQPSVIPSKHYPAISPITAAGDPVVSHTLYGRIKLFMENNPLDFNAELNSMRRARGLEPYSHRVNNYHLIVSQNIPVVVPINQGVFGGKPSDWHANAVLTDFIFLRTGAVPNLSPRFVKMLVDARAAKEPLVAMAFSSMPVPRVRILELAIMMVEQCARRPRVIALVGNANALRPEEDDLAALNSAARSIEIKAQRLIREGRLLVDAGAPFSKLFPQVDCVVAHGGLGTTGEILRAGKPCLTTGVLIMDQRFWGRRVFELGCGPAPVHVRDLHKVLVKDINACLAPGSSLAARAREVAAELDNESDGVDVNVSAMLDLMREAKPVRSHRESIMRSPRRLMSAMASDASTAARSDVDFVRGLITSMAVENAREIRSRVWGADAEPSASK